MEFKVHESIPEYCVNKIVTFPKNLEQYEQWLIDKKFTVQNNLSFLKRLGNCHFGCKKHFNGSNWVIEQIASYTAAVEKQLEENIPTKEVEEEEEITSPFCDENAQEEYNFPSKTHPAKNRKLQPCHL
ncbi:hypothetical protein CDAR_69391 [Caerostris darwini]|uniref:Uncharacterized protein n=1 Tax=Caerostris darwini TaxID=1538125 RepID=A0AAV4U0L0_9ARAC|nr:hypothetical protein CDAR_69391 [Caerostris darwini]